MRLLVGFLYVLFVRSIYLSIRLSVYRRLLAIPVLRSIDVCVVVSFIIVATPSGPNGFGLTEKAIYHCPADGAGWLVLPLFSL